MKRLSVVVLLFGSLVSAASQCDVTVKNALTTQGTAVVVPVLVATDFATQAFSFGVVHDPTKLELTAVEQGPVLEALTYGTGGHGPEWWIVNILSSDVTCETQTVRGASVACLYSGEVDTIPASATGHEMVDLTYVPQTGATSEQVRFAECVGNPPVTLRVIHGDGASFPTCVWHAGTVGVVAASFALSAGPEVAQGASFTLDASLSSQGGQGVGAFSFSVIHDNATLSLDTVTFEGCSAMTLLNGGIGPDYYIAQIYASGHVCGAQTVYGGSVVCTVDEAWAEKLPSGSPNIVAKLTYTARSSGFPSVTNLTFGDASCAPGGIVPSVSFAEASSMTPATAGTTVTVKPVAFVRGDTSQDGSIDIGDAVCVLGYLFGNRCSSLWCLESADINGSGAVDLADPVYILGYLFSSGPPPVSPYPTCGTVAGYAVGCKTFARCP